MSETLTQVYAYPTGTSDQFRVVYVPIDEKGQEITGKREEHDAPLSWQEIRTKFVVSNMQSKYNDLQNGAPAYLCEYLLRDTSS